MRIRVRMFGALEIENEQGTVIENQSRTSSYSWLLMKYLLVNDGRGVALEELVDTVWPRLEDSEKDYGAARVRLQRLRTALKPIGLNGVNGLVQMHSMRFSLNPKYEIVKDTDEIRFTMISLYRIPYDSPFGLQLCRDLLDIYRGPFYEYTDADCFEKYKEYYKQLFCDLGQDILRRMKATGDIELLPKLSQRVVAIAPDCEELGRGIISYMMDNRLDGDLMHFIHQLSRAGATWLEEDLAV